MNPFMKRVQFIIFSSRRLYLLMGETLPCQRTVPFRQTWRHTFTSSSTINLFQVAEKSFQARLTLSTILLKDCTVSSSGLAVKPCHNQLSSHHVYKKTFRGWSWNTSSLRTQCFAISNTFVQISVIEGPVGSAPYKISRAQMYSWTKTPVNDMARPVSQQSFCLQII